MNESYWILSSEGRRFKRLEEDLEIDTLIIGGGIVGVTTAYLLAKKGIQTAIVDANKIGYGSSGRNTGKITSQHGIIYSKISNKYNLESAKLYYEGNNKAINLIEEIIIDNKIDCNFERISSYIFTENENYLQELKDEYDICSKIGIESIYYDSLDIPFSVKGAIEFLNQAQFNPKKYIDALLSLCIDLGVKVYEDTPIVNYEKDDKYELKTYNKKTINALNVVLATHFPFYDGLNLYFSKEKADRSYLVCGEYKTKIPRGMYLNIDESGITFKTYEEDNKKLIIAGGGDHKVGQCKDESKIYPELEEKFKEKFNVEKFNNRWSSQDYISSDNIPYIGYINKSEDNMYVATGLCKWGMSNGTLAAMIIRDLICFRESKYEKLFNPSRKKNILTTEFFVENINVVMNYIEGKIQIEDEKLPIVKGEGKSIKIKGKRYGAYRDYDDKLYILDITCTHLGCELKFNSAEKTWDCPCHASRFDYKGNVIEGPAIKNLKLYGEGKNNIDPKLI